MEKKVRDPSGDEGERRGKGKGKGRWVGRVAG